MINYVRAADIYAIVSNNSRILVNFAIIRISVYRNGSSRVLVRLIHFGYPKESAENELLLLLF